MNNLFKQTIKEDALRLDFLLIDYDQNLGINIIQNDYYKIMFKYKSFWRLYAQSIVLSIPQIVTGYMCVKYLDYSFSDQKLEYEWFYIGLGFSCLFSPLMIQVTRFKLIWINTMMLIVGIIGLSTEDYSSQLVYKIFTCIIGIVIGCDWLLTIRFIREQVGWEEDRSIYLNNNPQICFFLGTLLKLSYIKNQDLEDEQIIISILVILTNSIRLLSFLTVYGKQSLEYYYRKFKELQGRVIIKSQFSRNIKEIEYFYISNNEKQSELNRKTSTLFSQQYRQDFFGCTILAFLSWFQISNQNYHINNSQGFEHPQRYFIPAFLTFALLSQIIYRKFNVRSVMVFFNIILLILSILQLIQLQYELLKNEEIYITFAMLYSYSTYFIGLNSFITQQLPYKGISYTLNLTFVSLCGVQQIDYLFQCKDLEKQCFTYFRYIQIIANALCLPILLILKNVRQLRECVIQQIYD